MSPQQDASFTNVLDGLFQPFYGLDFGVLYDRYHPIIDFVLFAFFFVAIARFTLEKRFPGRPGKAIAISIGFVLALSLVLAERSLGFSLRSFGPIAAGILIGTVGLTVFLLIKHAGAGTTTSGSLALIIVYFVLRAVAPGFYLWVAGNPWSGFLHSLLVIAVLVALFRVAKAMFGNRPGAALTEKLGKQLEAKPVERPFEQEEQVDQKEIGLLKHRLSKFTRQAVKNSEQITGDLREMITIVQEYGDGEAARKALAERLRQIAPRQHRVAKELARIRHLNSRTAKLDMKGIAELEAVYNELSAEQKRACRALVTEAQTKLQTEEKMKAHAQATAEYQKRFDYCLGMAVHALTAGRKDAAIDWMEKAITEERTAEELLSQLLDLEKRLLALAKKQLRQAKKAG